jgi:hypothetical protein
MGSWLIPRRSGFSVIAVTLQVTTVSAVRAGVRMLAVVCRWSFLGLVTCRSMTRWRSCGSWRLG